jgi:hypothetical protein
MDYKELKQNLEKAFAQCLKKQIIKDAKISEDISVLNVINVQATLQNDLNIVDLMSNKGTNLQFCGKLDFTIEIEGGSIDKMNIQYIVSSVKGKYLFKKNEFIFDENIIVSLINYQ